MSSDDIVETSKAWLKRWHDGLEDGPVCLVEDLTAEIERLRAEVQKLKVHAANLESALANPSPEDIGMVEVGVNSPHNYTVFDMADHSRTPIKYGIPLWRRPDEQ